mmetsp:Transcript_15606/g.28213  ORF Transcript_15606/g.28213 Transcript_15606/m.28213 type:complete len:180 (+) Transcript_15606:1-540(+)
MKPMAITLAFGAFLTSLVAFIMSNNISQEEYTTNELDRTESVKLKARLAASEQKQGKHKPSDFKPIDSVQIAQGRHKYVLVSAREPTSPEFTYFVTSRRGAAYHRNAAEPLVYSLKEAGYEDIEIKGGGRILCNNDEKKIWVFGFSYSFGQANHETSKRVILADERYKDYDVTVSNEGY